MSLHNDKGNKELNMNPVTCIAVHPLLTTCVAVGHQHGHIAIYDVTEPEKPLKVLKDAHKGVTVAEIAFCDYIKPNDKEDDEEKLILSYLMFVSIDVQGKVA